MKARAWTDMLFPPAARDFVWRLLDEPARWRFQSELRNIQRPIRREELALSYGNDPRQAPGAIVHGGRVKLRHLAEVFPEASEDFNVLYLVSSALPKFAAELVAWARGRGVKFVWNQNGVAYPAWSGGRSEKINGPMRALRQQADFIFYQSEFCRACADRFLGPAQAPWEIAYNCVDTTLFQPAPPPAISPCRLLIAGSHHESYRVITAVETVAALIRRGFAVELHAAGRFLWPGAEEQVAEKIRMLGVGQFVRRTAAYRQEEAPALYQSAHLLLHPKYKDPCPTVPIEAMACGVPVIGSATGGMPELVAAGAGQLIELPDSWEKNYWPSPEAMADAVQVVMGQWEQYRSAARAQAEAHFSKEAWVEKHRRVFTRFVATAP
jgi:glycosyltransferase involved in cell wall biosynthesis